MAILIHVVAAALYGAAAWAYWPAAGKPQAAGSAARWLLPLALGVHAAALAPALVTPEGLDISLPNAVSLVAGLVVLVAWASGFLTSLPGSAAIVLSVASVAALLPALFRDPHRLSFAGDAWAALHIAVALTAYAILLVAALAALLMTGLEKRLHKGLPAVGGQDTPPLLTLERYLFRLIAVGFVLLSLTLASGMLFSEEVFGRPFKLTHKSLFSLLAWLTFGALLVGRWRFGWRGRRARIWILAGAGLLVLAYLGSKFVLEVVLQR